jgi:predicted transcriptional regulator
MLPVVEDGKLVGCITRHRMLRGIMFMSQADESEVVRIEADALEAVKRPRAIEEMQKVFGSYSKSQLLSRVARKAK